MINSKKILQAFVAFAMLYCVLLYQGFDLLTWYLKPFLLPVLFFAVVRNEAFQTKKWLLAALFFSWIGDCILLFADKGQLCFIFGLVAFLIAHLFFIILFSRQPSENKHLKSPLFWIGFLAVIGYLISMISFLLPTLGGLKIPVCLYATIISIMLVIALKGAVNWQTRAKFLVLVGAVFFVASDSILAVDKFHASIASARYSIMITYLIAQFCITSGILELNKNALD